jgi:hypothetical protein
MEKENFCLFSSIFHFSSSSFPSSRREPWIWLCGGKSEQTTTTHEPDFHDSKIEFSYWGRFSMISDIARYQCKYFMNNLWKSLALQIEQILFFLRWNFKKNLKSSLSFKNYPQQISQHFPRLDFHPFSEIIIELKWTTVNDADDDHRMASRSN